MYCLRFKLDFPFPCSTTHPQDHLTVSHFTTFGQPEAANSYDGQIGHDLLQYHLNHLYEVCSDQAPTRPKCMPSRICYAQCAPVPAAVTCLQVRWAACANLGCAGAYRFLQRILCTMKAYIR